MKGWGEGRGIYWGTMTEIKVPGTDVSLPTRRHCTCCKPICEEQRLRDEKGTLS